MKKEDFRIIEFDGEFKIERICATKSNNLHWFNINDRGIATSKHFEYGWSNGLPMEPLGTIEAALKKVDIIVKGKIIHSLKND